MKQKAPQKSLEEEVPADQDFTGIARSVECFNNQGFRNFRIVTLTVVRGKVERQEYSDPYASFETISQMELANELSIIRLNSAWEAGKTLGK